MTDNVFPFPEPQPEKEPEPKKQPDPFGDIPAVAMLNGLLRTLVDSLDEMTIGEAFEHIKDEPINPLLDNIIEMLS